MDVIINGNVDELPLESNPLATQHDWVLNFLVSLGYQANNPPIGDFLSQYHQLNGRWIVASPIHWEATHNDALIMAASASLTLTDEESRSLFAAVDTFLSEDGLTLHYHNAHIWLVKVDDKPELVSPPPHLMLHHSMMPFLEKMDKTLYWQRIMTELQMFLSNKQGSVNGLWFYGSGLFAMASHKKIITDNQLLLDHFSSNCRALTTQAIDTASNDAILLITQQTSANIDHLSTNLKKHAVRWFWNNKAYSTPANHWWRRLWRGLVNAYQTKRTT